MLSCTIKNMKYKIVTVIITILISIFVYIHAYMKGYKDGYIYGYFKGIKSGRIQELVNQGYTVSDAKFIIYNQNLDNEITEDELD